MGKHVLLLLMAVSPLAAQAVEGSTPSAPSPYMSVQEGFSLSAQRGADGTFQVTALFIDPASGRILASPTMKVRAGQWGQLALSSADGARHRLSLSASVDPSGKIVAYHARSTTAAGNTRTFNGTALVLPW